MNGGWGVTPSTPPSLAEGHPWRSRALPPYPLPLLARTRARTLCSAALRAVALRSTTFFVLFVVFFFCFSRGALATLLHSSTHVGPTCASRARRGEG